MLNLRTKIAMKRGGDRKDIFRNEEGAIDLSSIMVGIIVIGLIGGVIAATVFAVIPWTQDNAAKQQLDSVVSAQNAYMGLTSSQATQLGANAKTNSFGSSSDLESSNLLKQGVSYCTVPSSDGKTYTAFSQSKTGQVWSVSSTNTKPEIYAGTLPTSCQFITEFYTGPYIDPAPKTTTLTFRCDTTTSGFIPMQTALTGTETWSDGTTNTYTNATTGTSKSLTAGQTYNVTFVGTYKNFTSYNTPLRSCLRSVDHWGSATGVTDATNAFWGAVITDVPQRIPTSITNMSYMFKNTSAFNDPDIGKWDVSNVANMSQMFYNTTAFNQPLNSWNTANVTTMSQMFESSQVFNQPLDNWNTSKVTDMSWMFNDAKVFNGAVNGWDTSKVTTMWYMFARTPEFNQPIDKWNVSNVQNMSQMFYTSRKFNQPLTTWNVSNVKNFEGMFWEAYQFNQPLNSWTPTSATNMRGMFYYATTFNQPLQNWDVSKVTNVEIMFGYADAFKQDLSSWKTVLVPANTVITYSGTFPTQYLPPNTVRG